ncbi:class II aldolase/adducin family protein [Agrobacterium larrymoorei]|uniref:Class II aldolase/adducin family protein n=1 Tax=Agrobacterium larrymoorei TaxID=160699 RepID=A0AAF0KJI9_9HYPH|nr:class II aldolase/adducin family protein [Agrobacterium larrymoorei]WHA42599.1 class II aldolase/adducin family protein [Agrobacterium larrymoorei]
MIRFAAIRQEVVDTSRYLADHGYFAGTGGNIGVRLDAKLMAVTPSATDYYAMGPADVPIIDIKTQTVVDGETTPTVEKALHACMIEAYPSRCASIHTHQPIASAVALLHEVLPWAPGIDRTSNGENVALIPYRPSGTSMLAKAFGKTIRPNTYAYLMASHGVICSAENLAAATAMLRQIEQSAQFYLHKHIQQNTTLDKQLRAFLSVALEKSKSKGA